jgi:hypothetical protein
MVTVAFFLKPVFFPLRGKVLTWDLRFVAYLGRWDMSCFLSPSCWLSEPGLCDVGAYVASWSFHGVRPSSDSIDTVVQVASEREPPRTGL